MENKFTFFVALFSLVLLSLSTVMAAPALSAVVTSSPANVYSGQNTSVTFNITNIGDSDLSLVSLALSNASLNLLYSESQSFGLAVNNSVTRTYSIITNPDSDMGAHTISISATGTNGTVNATVSASATFNILYEYCERTNNDTSPIRLIEIKNEDDITDDTYKPLESFDIKLKIQNFDDEDSIKAIIEAVLVQGDSEIDDTDIEKSVKIDKEDVESVTVNMTLPSDIESGIYYLYIKVYNDDDEDNCMQEVLPVEIKQSTRELVLSDMKVPTNLTCGAAVTLSGTIFNTGIKDEDKVRVVFSNGFGSSTTTVIDNFDSGDKSSLSFAMKVPANVTEGDYSVAFDVSYDYDEDDETYDETETTVYLFRAAGNCNQLISSQTITTEASTAIVGTESEVRVKIANTGTVSQAYAVSASADWADISSITPSSVVLNSGEEKEIILKINAKSSADIGVHSMIVNVQHGGVSESKTVDVNVQKSSSPSGIIEQLQFQMKYNPTWLVIDIVLVLAIIIVIVLLFSGKKSA